MPQRPQLMITAPRIAASLLVLAAAPLGSIAADPPTNPTSPNPTEQTRPSTPAHTNTTRDRLIELADRLSLEEHNLLGSIDREQLRIVPHEMVAHQPGFTREAILEALARHTDLIREIRAECGRQLSGGPDADVQRHVPFFSSARRLGRVLVAESIRLWEIDRLNEAVLVAADVVRLGRMLMSTTDSLERLTGSAIALLGFDALALFVDAGASTHIDDTTRASIRLLLIPFESGDPTGAIAQWPAETRASIARFRSDLDVENAGEVYAAWIATHGLNADPGWISPDARDIMYGQPLKSHAAAAKSFTREQLMAALDTAERMIEPMTTAMLADDQPAMQAMFDECEREPTRLTLLVIGSAKARIPERNATRKTFGTKIDRIKPLTEPRTN